MFDVQKFIKKISLKNQQRIVNKKFDEEGLTDEVIDLQSQINEERHKYDIPDENEIHSNGFAQ